MGRVGSGALRLAFAFSSQFVVVFFLFFSMSIFTIFYALSALAFVIAAGSGCCY